MDGGGGSDGGATTDGGIGTDGGSATDGGTDAGVTTPRDAGVFLMCPPARDAGTDPDDGGRGSDVTPPRLLGVTFSPTTIDTSAAEQLVTVDLLASDDLSGVAFLSTVFRSPSGNQLQQVLASDSDRVSGTALDGGWRATVRFPRYSEQGAWALDGITLQDSVRNIVSLRRAELADAGLPTFLTQSGAGDTIAPTLQVLDISPMSIDTSASARQVTVTMRVLDALSGTRVVNGSFSSPRNTLHGGAYSLVSGTPNDGVWSASISIPRYSPQGAYAFSLLSLGDELYNTRTLRDGDLRDAGFSIDLQQTGSGDMTPPRLIGLEFGPKIINTQSSSVTVCLTVRVSDDLSGPVAGAVFFSPPPGVNTLSPSGVYNLNVAGTVSDTTFVGTITFPRYAPVGTWTISSLSLRDEVGNFTSINGAAIDALGFPTTITVTP